MIPHEFTEEAIAAASEDSAFRPYHEFMRCKEPYRSMYEANPWLKPPGKDEALVWGEGRYYDTTTGDKHPFWREKDLPLPTKDIRQLRRDIYEWGYCLIEDGLSAEQVARLYDRVADQAEGEREAGLAYMSASFQIIWTLINKGDCFVDCLEHDPETVQSGPLVERLLHELLGGGWYNLSFAANIAFPGCHPQGLHQDQGMIHPFQTLAAPVLVNTMYILQDVDEVNGGTLIIPGSHKTLAEAGHSGVGELPPAINVAAKAGTIMLFDGRMLHGTGANRSERWRYVMTQASVKPWIRQQENWSLTVKPEILERASAKLIQRMGLQATAAYGMVEGYGMLGNGRSGDENGNIAYARRLMDQGDYVRMGALEAEQGRAIAEGRMDISLRKLQQHEQGRGESV